MFASQIRPSGLACLSIDTQNFDVQILVNQGLELLNQAQCTGLMLLIGQVQTEDFSPQDFAQLRRLELSGKPLFTLLLAEGQGPAFDLALAGHQRLCLQSQTQIGPGFPRNSPSLGAESRILRLLGLQQSLSFYFKQAGLCSPAQAQTWGLMQQIVADETQALAWAEQQFQIPAQHAYDQKGFQLPGGSLQQAKPSFLLMTAIAGLHALPPSQQAQGKALLATWHDGHMLPIERNFEAAYRHQLLPSTT